ncbi:hypothetical protein ACJZ2D_008840 [Fusarium nematophilum]
MFPLCRSARLAGVFLLLASPWAPLASALDIEYCASFNTGTTPRNQSIYQTNGLCHDFCIDDYAFAITQVNSCWCSNYVPSESTQDDVTACDIDCPAWPSEKCGGDGLYGYVSLGNVLPSGTRGPSSSATEAPSPTTAAISKVTKTVQNTVTVEPSSESSTTEEPETSTTDEETSTSTEEESSSTTSEEEEPTSLVQTVTAGGTIKTVTIAPTQATAGTSASDNTGVSVKDGGLSTGQVVGIVVGVIAAVIGAAGLALFFWFRRKKERNEQEAFHDDPSIRDSSSGIAQRPDMSMAGGSTGSAAAAASNRNSALQIDPRMDPFKQGLYVRSASHESINTLRDDHDYSRRIQGPKVLRATNPDPTPEP